MTGIPCSGPVRPRRANAASSSSARLSASGFTTMMALSAGPRVSYASMRARYSSTSCRVVRSPACIAACIWAIVASSTRNAGRPVRSAPPQATSPSATATTERRALVMTLSRVSAGGASVIKCCYAATGMYHDGSSGHPARVSERQHVAQRRNKAPQRHEDVPQGQPPRGESCLHRGSPRLASELQRPMGSNEVVVAAQQFEVRLERVRRPRMGERPS